MMNFTDAQMEGGIDKKFQDQYNYLVQLLSTYLTRGLISNVSGTNYFDLKTGNFFFGKDANNYIEFNGTDFIIHTANAQIGGTGIDSLGIGVGVISSGDNSVAIGNSAEANIANASAFGRGAKATGYSSVAVGRDASATGFDGIAVGMASQAHASGSMALGYSSSAHGVDSTAIGTGASSPDDNTIVLGKTSTPPTIIIPGDVVFGSDTLITATYEDSWEAYAVGHDAVYSKIGNRVYLGGTVKTGAVPSTIFTLDVGYRPTHAEYFAVVSNGAFGYCTINTTGTVVASVGSSTWFSLAGISIRV